MIGKPLSAVILFYGTDHATACAFSLAQYSRDFMLCETSGNVFNCDEHIFDKRVMSFRSKSLCAEWGSRKYRKQ